MNVLSIEERVNAQKIIETYIDSDGNETPTSATMIIYSRMERTYIQVGGINKMSYREYEGKDVKIKLKIGQIIKGNVGDYIFSDDNYNGKESLLMDMNNGDCHEVFTEDIDIIEKL